MGTGHDFAAVDAGDARGLVAMMDATDAWPAVVDARAWVLEQAAACCLDAGTVVVDAGCGPGTFGSAVAGRGAFAVDIDSSVVMLDETRRRRATARVVLGDVARLPVRSGAAPLVRAERVLQWTADPVAALAELHRVTAAGGLTAVTDTDWGTLTVDHPDPAATERLAAAALRWVPHPRFARDLRGAMAAFDPAELQVRTDTAVLSVWDPDDPAQHDGPPGLPLRTIAAAASTGERRVLETDLAVLADAARRGRFSASLVLVTAVAQSR